MASTSWSAEAGSGLPRVTITLDSPVYSGVNVTGVVGTVDYMGPTVGITFMSEDSARTSMPDVLSQLKQAGGIHGYMRDDRTNAATY